MADEDDGESKPLTERGGASQSAVAPVFRVGEAAAPAARLTERSDDYEGETAKMLARASKNRVVNTETVGPAVAMMGCTPQRQQTMKVVGLKDNVESFWRAWEEDKSLPVLEPNGYFIRIWRPTIFFLTIYAVLALPFEFAFSWWKKPTSLKVFGYLVDIMFLLDIAIHFNLAFVHGDHVVTDRQAMAVHYMKTWLIVDLGSNVPWDWFVGSTGKHRKAAKLLKLPKILRFVRMLRLLKDQIHYIGIGAIIILMLIFAHYSSCLWTLALLTNNCDEDSTGCPSPGGSYAEGLSISLSAISGSDAWTRLVYGGSNGGSRIARFRNGEHLHGWEEIFSCFIVIVGFMCLACLFGTVNHALNHLNARGRTRYSKLEARKFDMRQARVPLDLQHRVEATYEHAWVFGDWHDGFLTDEMLSLDLRRNLAYHVYGPALRAVPMLSKMACNDLKCLAQKIKSCCFTPGDLIIQAGERAAEIFLVFSGVAQPLDRAGSPMRQVFLKKGDFFGEICFLFPGRRRTASVICVEFCRLMVLTLCVFTELGLEHLLAAVRENCAHQMDLYVMAHTECVLPADHKGATDGSLGSKSYAVAGALERSRTRTRTFDSSARFDGDLASGEPDGPDSECPPAEPVVIGVPQPCPQETAPPGKKNGFKKKQHKSAKPPPNDRSTEREQERAESESPPEVCSSSGANNHPSTDQSLTDDADQLAPTPNPQSPCVSSKAATEEQLEYVIGLITDLREAGDRNAAELMNRLQEVEAQQAKLLVEFRQHSACPEGKKKNEKNPARLAPKPPPSTE